MVIVDTTVWVDYFRGLANPFTIWLDRELGRQPLAIIDLILCEVLQGIRDDADYALTRDSLSRLRIFHVSGVDQAIGSAQNYRTLRRRGYTVRKTIDCWIATFCIENGHQLVHRDHDFDAFEKVLGLQVIHP